MAEEIITREDARDRGLNHYFTGFPCKHGHLSPRYTYNTKCVACIAAYHQRTKERAQRRGKAYRSQNDRSEYQKAYYIQNKERVDQRNKDWVVRNRERKVEYLRAWRADNADRLKILYLKNKEQRDAKLKVYRSQNKEKIYRTIKAWNFRNRERVRSYRHKRRALDRGASGTYTAQDLQEILRLQKNRCANCRAKFCKNLSPTVDHIIALVNGGSNDRKNLQYLCMSCNCRKKHLDPIVFSRRQGMLI